MRISIAGFGLEGRSNYRYFTEKFPNAEIVIFDENEAVRDLPRDAEAVLGSGAFEKISGFDLVVRTAGLAPRKIAQTSNHWSSTREFFDKCPAPIIGVTGSKGKGTTCSFIVSIIREHFASTGSAAKVHLVGNIGVPALEVLPDVKPDDVIVYEMSSFQLWDIEKSPHVAVMTLLEPDHLDVHSDMDEYTESKSHIFAYQNENDLAVYNEQDLAVGRLANRSRARKIPFMNKKFVHVEQGKFYYGDNYVCSIDAMKLPGDHNIRNAAAAISATWNLVDGNTDSIARGLSDFGGLPHRLKFVRDIEGVKFYDDGIATTPGSAIAAVKSFTGPKIMIVGGHDKGADYTELGRAIELGNVKSIYAIGANRDKIAEQIANSSKVSIHKIDSKSMKEIVEEVSKSAVSGDIVILSPAAASFDMFRDYKDRSQQFIDAVNGLVVE